MGLYRINRQYPDSTDTLAPQTANEFNFAGPMWFADMGPMPKVQTGPTKGQYVGPLRDHYVGPSKGPTYSWVDPCGATVGPSCGHYVAITVHITGWILAGATAGPSWGHCWPLMQPVCRPSVAAPYYRTGSNPASMTYVGG